jgi:hypothetical protein
MKGYAEIQTGHLPNTSQKSVIVQAATEFEQRHEYLPIFKEEGI